MRNPGLELATMAEWYSTRPQTNSLRYINSSGQDFAEFCEVDVAAGDDADDLALTGFA